jgi:hypothetical protein
MYLRRLTKQFLTLALVLIILMSSINYSLSNFSKAEHVSTGAVYTADGSKTVCLIEGTAHSLKQWHQKLLLAFRAAGGPSTNPAPTYDSSNDRT